MHESHRCWVAGVVQYGMLFPIDALNNRQTCSKLHDLYNTCSKCLPPVGQFLQRFVKCFFQDNGHACQFLLKSVHI